MRALALLLALGFASALVAQEKHNALVKKEIDDGWLLLFDGESLIGWPEADSKRTKVLEGALVIDNTGAAGAAVLARLLPFDSFEITFDYQIRSPEDRVVLDLGSTISLLRATAKKMLWHAYKGEVTPTRATRGGTPFSISLAKDQVLALRNLKLKPTGLKSIYNGKDLTGWKVFPDKKSKFTVKEGAINIVDGPGDLQTEGKYNNFVLQLEAISHGPGLNSGVFFRCRANEYQNGYEAQINNKYLPAATKEVVVEDYDAKTHALLGKRTIKVAAEDYGTGAIYRRIPASKQAAKDGEWFAMTVVASGNHLSTWVNGIPMVDWHDHRPISDNARKGCKLEAGHISLQGHDPTTNLSFRNFRIAEIAP